MATALKQDIYLGDAVEELSIIKGRKIKDIKPEVKNIEATKGLSDI